MSKIEEKYLKFLELNEELSSIDSIEYVAKDLAIRFAIHILEKQGENTTGGIYHHSKWIEEVDKFIDEQYR